MSINVTPFSFELPDVSRGVVHYLGVAVEKIMPEIMIDHNLQDRLNYGQFRWNVIIAQLREMCQHIGWLELALLKRRAWKTPVLFHPASRYIFTLMTEDTFKDIQRRPDKGKHYLCGAASFNEGIKVRNEQLMLELPPIERADEKWVVCSREQFASVIDLEVGDIAGHILILFDEKNDMLLSVRAVRLTSDLAISLEEEDWSRFIRMPYDTTPPHQPQMHNIETEEEELVELLED